MQTHRKTTPHNRKANKPVIITRWGNSAAVRLSSAVLAKARLGVFSHVTIHAEDGRIVIEAAPEPAQRERHLPFSEDTLLAGLNAHTAHADELATITSQEIGE